MHPSLLHCALVVLFVLAVPLIMPLPMSVAVVGHLDHQAPLLPSPETPSQPVLTLSSPTNTTYTLDSIPLSYSVTGATTLSVVVDGAVNTTSIPSGIILDFSDGSHNLSLVASDSMGNNVSRFVLFFVDTTPPTLTLLSPVNQTYDSQVVPLSYEVGDVTSFGIFLDGVLNQTPVPSGTFLEELSEGPHSLRLVALDSAGNIRSVTQDFTVDSIAPVVTIVFPTNQSYNSQSAIDLTFEASEAATVTIFVDGQANQTVVSNHSFLFLDLGSHNLTILAIDHAGNIGLAMVLFTVVPVSSSSTIPTSTEISDNRSTLPTTQGGAAGGEGTDYLLMFILVLSLGAGGVGVGGFLLWRNRPKP